MLLADEPTGNLDEDTRDREVGARAQRAVAMSGGFLTLRFGRGEAGTPPR